MSKTMKNIPKVRFPEFRDTPEWEIKPLKNRAENLDNLRIPITEGERRKGDIPYYGASGIIDYVEDYIFHEDLLCVSEDGANLVMRNYPIAFSIAGKTWVNNHAHVLRFKEKFTQIIIENYLNSMKLDDYLTGMAQPKLNKAMLDSIPIPLPFELKEQQKIAECLSSIDALILAQSSKVEALKAHKKALMQQLFPTEGETTPHLRFPEFQNAPEWEEKPLGSFCFTTTGKLDANAMVANGQYRFYTCAKDYFFIDEYAFDTEALLISGNGANVGYIHYYNGKFNAYQRTYVLDKFTQNIVYIKFYLEQHLHKRINEEKKEGNTPYIVMSALTEMPIKLPKSTEQQKIADCLNSIDELITAQSAKVEALKQHKKALMQQLFPTCKVTS